MGYSPLQKPRHFRHKYSKRKPSLREEKYHVGPYVRSGNRSSEVSKMDKAILVRTETERIQDVDLASSGGSHLDLSKRKVIPTSTVVLKDLAMHQLVLSKCVRCSVRLARTTVYGLCSSKLHQHTGTITSVRLPAPRAKHTTHPIPLTSLSFIPTQKEKAL